MQPPGKRHLLLVGGGHAHVGVLRSLAMRPEARLRVTLVSPSSQSIYSGMVPGVLAGLYPASAAQIDVRALAARAGAAFVPDRAVRIDPLQRRVELGDRPPISYDLLSLDVGSQPAGADRIGDDAPVILVKPIERVVVDLEAALGLPASPGGRRVVIVGAGPGGTEIAFALAARLRRNGMGSVIVCDKAVVPVAERDPKTSQVVLRAFARHAIEFRGDVQAARAERGGVTLASGEALPADLIVWATGAAGPDLFKQSGLPVDERGFLRVGPDLACVAHPEIFAAGDCATLDLHPNLPKAGVYAVRQGPTLTANLRAALRGRRRHQFRPQKHFLSLMNTADGCAILSYRGYALWNRWAWWLKDRIDRAFIRRYARPPLQPAGAMDAAMIACGGCAAKIGADSLARVLSKLELKTHPEIVIGVTEADDAAVFTPPAGTLAVATLDAFPPFMDDLYVVGQVAANNAASDLYAMGAEGAVALASVCLPQASPAREEEQLELFLRGALQQLDQLGIALAGGHTVAGEQTLVGFSMHGWVPADGILRKAGACPGDSIVLGKPLGTGVILAAARAGVAAADWVEAALVWMRRSNAPLMRLLRQHGVRACTDVTGFGLAGHLDEMLRASRVGARLRRASIPALAGARELLEAGWRSSFHVRNESPLAAQSSDPLLWDPQTSGGLLAAVPPPQVDALIAACQSAGEPLYVIGQFTAGVESNAERSPFTVD